MKRGQNQQVLKERLFASIENGDLETIIEVLKQGAEVNLQDETGRAALHVAASHGYLDIVERLVERGANLSLQLLGGRVALHLAAEKGHLGIVRYLVKECRADINIADEYGSTTLHCAATNGHVEVVMYVVEEVDADINLQDKEGKTALHLAAENGRLNVVRYLLEERNVEVNLQDKDGSTALHFAAYNGHLGVVRYLVEECDMDINVVNKEGNTALHFAAYNGHLGVVRYLLEGWGVGINLQNNNGSTALHFAASNGHLDVVRHLVGQGAGINLHDNKGDKAFYLAAWKGHLNVVRYLAKESAIDSNCNGQDGYTAVQRAVQKGYLNIVQYLVEEWGGEISLQDKDGKTMLHFAAQEGRLNVVRYFLEERGADINVANNDGSTALHFAAEKGHLDLVRYLIEKGAYINLPANDGSTVLHFAAQEDRLNVVRYFVEECGADINVANKDGDTALHLAAWNGCLAVASYLVSRGANIGIRASEGLTAQSYALANGHIDVAQFLANWAKGAGAAELSHNNNEKTKAGMLSDSSLETNEEPAAQNSLVKFKEQHLIKKEEMRNSGANNNEQKSNKAPKAQNRTWAKWWGEKWTCREHDGLMRALAGTYANGTLLPLFNYQPATFSWENYYVNLAIIEQQIYQQSLKDYNNLAGQRQDFYERAWQEKHHMSVDQIFPDLDRDKVAGRVLITGDAGSGKSTLLGYISYLWGLRRTSWYNRFEFVFLVKLNLLGSDNNIQDFPSLVYKSLHDDVKGQIGEAEVRKVLREHRDRVLFLLDGFDEVSNLYKNSTHRAQGICNTALNMPNVVMTSRPVILEKHRDTLVAKFDRCFENTGLTPENIRQYITKFFANEPGRAEILKRFITNNTDLLTLCRVPVNLALFCFTFEGVDLAELRVSSGKNPPITSLYDRLLSQLANRYEYHHDMPQREYREREDKWSPEASRKREGLLVDFLAHLAYQNLRANRLTITAPEYDRAVKTFLAEQELIHAANRLTAEEGLCSDFAQKVIRFGLLRSDGSQEAYESMSYYFLHFTLQEFMAALYIAKTLAHGILQEKHELFELIKAERYSAFYKIVWRFVAGLTAKPEYQAGKELFWGAILWDKPSLCTSLNLLGTCKAWQLYLRELTSPIVQLTSSDRDSESNLAKLHMLEQAIEVWEKKLATKREDTDPKVIQALLAKLEDRGAWVRRNAAEALGKLGLSPTHELYSQAIQALIVKLEDKSDEGRREAVGVLGELGLPSTPELQLQLIQALIAKLEDSEERVRSSAAEALGKLGLQPTRELYPQVIQALIAKLADSKYDVRLAAAAALGKSGLQPTRELYPQAIQALIAKLEDSSEEVRRRAAWALGKLGLPLTPELQLQARQALIAKLEDSSEEVRINAAGALGKLGLASTPELQFQVIQALVAKLEDRDESVRREAVEALGKLGLPATPELQLQAIQALITKLEDSTEEVCADAAEALAKMLTRNDVANIAILFRAFVNKVGNEAWESPREALAKNLYIYPTVLTALYGKSLGYRTEQNLDFILGEMVLQQQQFDLYPDKIIYAGNEYQFPPELAGEIYQQIEASLLRITRQNSVVHEYLATKLDGRSYFTQTTATLSLSQGAEETKENTPALGGRVLQALLGHLLPTENQPVTQAVSSFEQRIQQNLNTLGQHIQQAHQQMHQLVRDNLTLNGGGVAAEPPEVTRVEPELETTTWEERTAATQGERAAGGASRLR